MTIEMILARYGLLALFIGAGVEGETVVVSGGILAHQKLISFEGAMVAAAAGSFVADQIFFAIGRHFRSHAFVQKIAAKPAFGKALAALERHPTGFILAFRFIYGLRTISPFAIGATTIPVRTFVLLNLIAASVWGVLFTSLGYMFGHGLQQIFGKALDRVDWPILAFVVAVVGVAAIFVIRRLFKHR
ncbi:DedA family protein [Govanella unica]|uniref:DedA family protein n=1 Tax=Govanella unica TaxID=2975056 RepID=A0A9X3TXQ6_9PROT|nr:DedA family protein [Govania unica]MDA5193282.1 DedA family protein [Govania unica]